MAKFIDLSGKTFGKLIVLERAANVIEPNGKPKTMWLCQCECGNKKIIQGNSLRSGATKSCGCTIAERSLAGKTFGELYVISKDKDRISSKGNLFHVWKCRCSCGKEVEVYASNLRSGHTKSCGHDANKILQKSHMTHGKSGTRLHMIWKGMKGRCSVDSNYEFPNYGGRGICVCDEWKYDFSAFCDWALNNGYEDDLTIERIDVDGNYCPENCRWATIREQGWNKRNTKYVTVNGQTKCFAEWCLLYGIRYKTAYSRFTKGIRGEALFI